MENIRHNGYRKNFYLILTFIVLISFLFIVSLFFAFNFSKKNIEGEFVSEKISVLDESIRSYNDFFQNKIPEISYYNGFLDSITGKKFADSMLVRYPFVSDVIFYDAEVKNVPVKDGVNANHFGFGPKHAYKYSRDIHPDSIEIFSNENTRSFYMGSDFNDIAFKLISFIEHLDTTKVLSQETLFDNFSVIKSNRIIYLNIPRREDMRIYQEMVKKKLEPAPVYQQDIFVFNLDPSKLNIVNKRPNLYEEISIESITYDPINLSDEYITSEITLPGAFSGYKLYFKSSRSYLKKEIFNFFLPIAIIILLVYCMLILVAFLIFRNLNINSRMFKLQYDFINNLTHEFKTPVSVIKIAGNNIRSAASLSEKEQKHYGKILDEEADKLNGLMNKLLDFTQIENRSIALNFERIDIEDFIISTVEVHTLKHPDFKMTYQLSGFKHLVTDPVLLGSLFDNLAENAYKYSVPERKFLDISAKLIRNKVVFRFVDQGIGIPEKELKNVFKKFYRVQNQFNQTGSVGLGLAFCKELANFMGGDITVRSRVGKGTEFKIVLPYDLEESN